MKAYMFMVKCSNGLYYTGSTLNVEKRIEQLNDGRGNLYTNNHSPVTLVYHEEFPNIKAADARIKELKIWSRAKKDQLVSTYKK